MSRFVTIGGGECGGRAAFALREKGFAGEIMLIAGEPLAPYERPPLSKAGLIEAGEPKWMAAIESYRQGEIDLVTGVAATSIDTTAQTVALSDGRSLRYDKLLLATGGSARGFPGVTSTHGRIRTLRTHADTLALRPMMEPGRHVVIIGGGFIGLELAASGRHLGATVTVVEGLPRVLKRGVPEEIAEVISERHRQEGVDLRCGQAIKALEEDAHGARILLADGETIEADLVIVGIGASPNTALAEGAGLAVENGIAVDTYLETSQPGIYAAGDCCSFPHPLYGGRRIRLESWRNAQEQGALAAANMLGEGRPVSAVPWFWSDQYDMTLQIAGLAEGATTTLRRDLGEVGFLLFHLDETGRMIAASGIGRGNAVARDIRLAEMLIAARACPAPEALTASSVKLKSLLAA
jgi:3-phenylpropionate/trans-cinnamate dioxygenase ferredoxin reductase subunit